MLYSFSRPITLSHCHTQLVAQYLKLCKPPVDPNMVGLVNLRTSPFDVASSAIADASHICSRAHGDAPEVLIVGRTDLTFPYVPSHLNYVLVELLKNSMRATVETHGVDSMPPIKVVIADGEDNEDVSRGGGRQQCSAQCQFLSSLLI